MKIHLTIKDRLTILNLLPNKGSIEELIEISNLIKILTISKLEKEIIEMKEDNNQINWNPSKETCIEFELTFNQVKIIKDKIQTLNSNNEISLYILDTCLKFYKL